MIADLYADLAMRMVGQDDRSHTLASTTVEGPVEYWGYEVTKPLRLEDGAIAECVAICNALIVDLDDAIYEATSIGRLTGFGGFVSAQQLQAGFQNKIEGTPESMVERLTQFRDVIEIMKANFAAGGEAFADTDGALQQALLAMCDSADA